MLRHRSTPVFRSWTALDTDGVGHTGVTPLIAPAVAALDNAGWRVTAGREGGKRGRGADRPAGLRQGYAGGSFERAVRHSQDLFRRSVPIPGRARFARRDTGVPRRRPAGPG